MKDDTKDANAALDQFVADRSIEDHVEPSTTPPKAIEPLPSEDAPNPQDLGEVEDPYSRTDERTAGKRKLSKLQLIALTIGLVIVAGLGFLMFGGGLPKSAVTSPVVTSQHAVTAQTPSAPGGVAILHTPAAPSASTSAPAVTHTAAPASSTGAAADWAPTAAGISSHVNTMFDNPRPDAITTSSTPLANADHPFGARAVDEQTKLGLQDAQGRITSLASEADDLKAALADRDKSLADVNAQLKNTNARLAQLGDRLQALQSEVEVDKELEISKPPLVLHQIIEPDTCTNCSAVAVIEYNGGKLSLADGDTFSGYRVHVVGNRLVLTNTQHQFSYFIDGQQ